MSYPPRAPFALVLALLIAAICVSPAAAQPVADRSELEEKKRIQEEKRKQIEKMKEEATRETADQKEARLRSEKKVANQQAALEKAKEALAAASRRQNKKGQDLMAEAWKLDPGNMDYPFNTAAFAEANNDPEMEFWAYSGFMALALNELAALGPSTSEYKTQIENRVQKARTRMDAVRSKVSSGMVSLEVDPKDCEIYLDGAYLGRGKGKIEALTGSREVRTDCQGYKPFVQQLNVRAGDANTALLRPKPIDYYGYLIFNVKPDEEVTVFLDDVEISKRVGAEPNPDGVITGTGSKKDPIRLHARKWIIRFYKKGFDRWHRRIEIRRDQITVVNAALEKISDTVEASGND